MSGIVAQNIGKHSGLIKAPGGGGAWNFIKKLTASGASTLSFVDGSDDVVFDSTYKEYIFYIVNMNPSGDGANFLFDGSTDTGSSYGVTKNTTMIETYNYEDGSGANTAYQAGSDTSNATDSQILAREIGSGGDECSSGYIHVFNPAGTTFVTHFASQMAGFSNADYHVDNKVAGYFNTTSAIDAIQFSVSSGTFDGVVFLHGLST